MDPRRLFYVVGGLILAVGSLAFGVLPGPGILTFFVGVGMIAGEFRPVARLLDWSEVRARGVRPVGRRYLGVVRSGEGLGRVRGSDLPCGGPWGGLPLALRWLTSPLIHRSASRNCLRLTEHGPTSSPSHGSWPRR
jgi:hypothetical protein